MRSRSASRVSVSPIQRLLFGFVVFVLTAPITSAQTSRSPNDLLKEAIAAHQAGKLDQAIEDYRSFLQSYPDVAPVRSDLGAALAGAGRYEEAIIEYKRALEFKSLPEVRLNLALAYYKTAKLSEAIAELEKVHQEKPAELRPVLLLADCNLRLGENKKVIELLSPLQKANPDDLAIVYMLGTALVRDGQADKGQVLIDKILKNGDSAETRLLLGTTKLMVSDFAGALVDLQKAVELNPNLPEVYAYYGTALLSTGDQTGALEAFKRALQDDPNNFESNLRMGMLLRKDEDFDGALPYLKHALEIRPGDLGVRYQIASLELARGNVEQARTQLESIVSEAPNFTEAHVSLATAYYREKKKLEGDRERAIVVKLNADKQSNANEKGAKASP
jgi:tetratricopeptide (TPR) repeat protein